MVHNIFKRINVFKKRESTTVQNEVLNGIGRQMRRNIKRMSRFAKLGNFLTRTVDLYGNSISVDTIEINRRGCKVAYISPDNLPKFRHDIRNSYQKHKEKYHPVRNENNFTKRMTHPIGTNGIQHRDWWIDAKKEAERIVRLAEACSPSQVREQDGFTFSIEPPVTFKEEDTLYYWTNPDHRIQIEPNPSINKIIYCLESLKRRYEASFPGEHTEGRMNELNSVRGNFIVLNNIVEKQQLLEGINEDENEEENAHQESLQQLRKKLYVTNLVLSCVEMTSSIVIMNVVVQCMKFQNDFYTNANYVNHMEIKSFKDVLCVKAQHRLQRDLHSPGIELHDAANSVTPQSIMQAIRAYHYNVVNHNDNGNSNSNGDGNGNGNGNGNGIRPLVERERPMGEAVDAVNYLISHNLISSLAYLYNVRNNNGNVNGNVNGNGIRPVAETERLKMGEAKDAANNNTLTIAMMALKPELIAKHVPDTGHSVILGAARGLSDLSEFGRDLLDWFLFLVLSGNVVTIPNEKMQRLRGKVSEGGYFLNVLFFLFDLFSVDELGCDMVVKVDAREGVGKEVYEIVYV